VPVDKKKAFFGLLIAGVAGGLLLLPAIYFIGLSLAPPRPVPAATHVTPLLADAIWARADGGRATALTPVNPFTLGRFAACMAYEDFRDKTPGDPRRAAACRGHLPAIQGVEYLAGVHMRDANAATGGFREAIGQVATAAWVTRSWTKAEFIDTLAERGGFGFGFRGVDAAAQGYFGRPAAALTVAQAALVAAFIADRHIDPWCDPAAAAEMRRRILERMRDNGSIDEAAYQSSNASELGLISPPAHHQPCAG